MLAITELEFIVWLASVLLAGVAVGAYLGWTIGRDRLAGRFFAASGHPLVIARLERERRDRQGRR